jgi:hypothetical protein
MIDPGNEDKALHDLKTVRQNSAALSFQGRNPGIYEDWLQLVISGPGYGGTFSIY